MQKIFIPALYGMLVLALATCGGGSSSSGGTTTNVPNVAPIIVDAGPANTYNVNVPFTTVTICAPNNPSNCQTIDNIVVDTASSGLRIISSVLSASLVLPQQTDTTGNAIVECAMFADGYTWGPIKTATMQIAGEIASSIPIQVIGDPNFSTVPSACSSTGPAENTVQTFGANGILGVGNFLQDCGPACAQAPQADVYYACSAAGCQSTIVSLAQQVPNPVALFATDNNGVIISLPAISSDGALNVSGSLVFGIGTQANNGLGNAQVFAVDSSGYITTVFNNQSFGDSFIDSGSNGLFFPSSTLPVCSDFYCPTTTQNYSAMIQGTNTTAAMVTFSVANVNTLFVASNGTFTAFNDLAGTNPDSASFDWGLPFFFGRNVFTAIEGQNAAGSIGPYVAF